MPRTIPQACSAIAADIASLEAADQAIRTELASATGAAAWAALARLGQGRQALERKRAELDLCVRNNSPALQGNLVVMNVASSGDGPLARVAHLWDLTQSTASEREASPVQADAFSFKGPLPGEFGLTIATTGSPTIIGPDFRSAAITPQSLPPDASVRVEILLLPDIRIEQDEVSRLVAAARNNNWP